MSEMTGMMGSGTGTLTLEDEPAPRAERHLVGIVGRLLAVLGAALFAVAFWLPWVAFSPGAPKDATSYPAYLLGLPDARHDRLVLVGIFSVLGLLLCPIMWRRADSLVSAVAAHVFALWTLFATLVTIHSVRVLTGSRGIIPGEGQVIRSPYVAPSVGLWLIVAALVMLWLAVVMLLVHGWRVHPAWHPHWEEFRRSRVQLPGATVLTIGLLIWAYGFLFSAWATVNCFHSSLLFSTCAGIGAPASSGVGMIVLDLNSPRLLENGLAISPLAGVYALPALLGGGSILLFVGAWMRSVSRAYCVWGVLWLAAATLAALLAYTGVRAIVEDARTFGLAPGRWGAESGLLITTVGLFVIFAGLLPLAISTVVRRRAAGA